VPALFLLAYTCSGLAGLIYQVSWTRLLTLHIGHTTAAASAVVAAFLGGLAVGAVAGGVIASRLSRRGSLLAYALLEIGVGAAALALPMQLSALTPLLVWAYGNGAPGPLFPTIRLLSCFVMVFVPAAALGATFPMAIRWFASDAGHPAWSTSALYTANTAAGALLAGFVLIPAIGLMGTTRLGVAASLLAALSVCALLLADRRGDRVSAGVDMARVAPRALPRSKPRVHAGRAGDASDITRAPRDGRWLAVAILGLSGFAALMHEIAWTRILALVLGPTIYAFSGTVACVIAGVACGSGVGTWLVNRTRRPAVWVTTALAGAAMTATFSCALAGGQVPRLVAQQLASTPASFVPLLQQGLLLTTVLILPTAVCLGALFPLTLSIVGGSPHRVAGRFAVVYAVNTLGNVSGALAAGFVFIPHFGLQGTLRIVSGCLILAALIVVVWGIRAGGARVGGALATAAAAATLVFTPPWDRELLASGRVPVCAVRPEERRPGDAP
jgi:spermidine synthase